MADIYTILEQALEDKVMLGTGSFGYVYKATWNRQSVAVKYFNQKPIGDDQSSKREIEVLTHLEALQHPNIIRIYGMGVSGPQMFMVMELAPFALDHILHECNDKYDYSTDHVISWSLQLAKALECCHQNGVIHRDIKPSNILLFDNGVNLKICDFGTAKKLEATFAHTFIGTPYYLAPEIMSDDCGHTYMCDMYSFAITLWEMVTRHKPTLSLKHKKTPNAMFVFNSVGKGERPPLIVGIPSFLSEIITRCWSHNPHERFTASQIASKLHNVATRYFNDNFPLIEKKRRSQTEIVHVGQTPKPVERHYSNPPPGSNEMVMFVDPENLEVTDSYDDEGTLTDREPLPVPTSKEPVQAGPGSHYYIEGLEQELQPYIPLENNQESMTLYNNYVSYITQKFRLSDEIKQLEDDKLKTMDQITLEDRKNVTNNSMYQRYKSILKENELLTQELDSLKL